MNEKNAYDGNSCFLLDLEMIILLCREASLYHLHSVTTQTKILLCLDSSYFNKIGNFWHLYLWRLALVYIGQLTIQNFRLLIKLCLFICLITLHQLIVTKNRISRINLLIYHCILILFNFY